MNRINYKIFASIAIAASIYWGFESCRAAEGNAYSLDELIEIAMQRNPEILAAEESMLGAQHRVSIAKGYPDPTLTFTYFPQSIETRLGPQQSILQFGQQIPFLGKRSAKGTIAAYDPQLIQERLDLVRLRIRRQVKEAYYSLLAVDEITNILNEEGAVLERIEQLVSTRLETGGVHQHDLLKIQVQRLKLQDRKLSYEQRRVTLRSTLAELINSEDDHTFEIKPDTHTSDIDISIEELQRLALEHPELRMGELAIEQGVHSIGLARKGYLPDLTIGMSYFMIGESPFDIDESGKDAWNVSIGVRIPLWFGKVRGSVGAAKSRVRYSEYEYEAAKTRIITSIKSLLDRYEIAREMAVLHRDELIPRAQKVLRSAEAGYMAGEVDFLSVLDSEIILHDLKISLAEKTAELERLAAALEEAVGIDLHQVR